MNTKNIIVAEIMKLIYINITMAMRGVEPTTNHLVKAAQKSLVDYIPDIFDYPHTRTLEFEFKLANPIDGGTTKPKLIKFKLPVNEVALLLRSSKCKST